MINLEIHEQLSNMILPGPIEIDEICIYKNSKEETMVVYLSHILQN